MEAVLKTSLFFLKRINLLKCFKSFKVLYLLVVKLGEIFVQWNRLLRTEKGGIHSLAGRHKLLTVHYPVPPGTQMKLS